MPTCCDAYLARNGVRAERVARDPARANLIARVKGRGTGPSLALAGHTDVVYADPADWSTPPFGGELRDGHLWGRGALDMKGQTAASAVALAVLARSGWVPNGDVLLIAEADEEDGVDEVGMPWLVAERPDLHCDYLITESSVRYALADGRTVYTLIVGEKKTMPVRVVVRGVAGHASVPTLGDNALPKLAPVIDRLAAYEPVRRPSPSSTPRWTSSRRVRAPWRSASSAGARSTPELWHTLPAVAGSTIVADDDRGLAQAQRDSGRGVGRIRLPRAARHRARGAAGRVPRGARRSRRRGSSCRSCRWAARARRSARRSATRSPSGSRSSSRVRCSCRI